MFSPSDHRFVSESDVVTFIGDSEPKTTKVYGQLCVDAFQNSFEEISYSVGGSCAELEVWFDRFHFLLISSSDEWLSSWIKKPQSGSRQALLQTTSPSENIALSWTNKKWSLQNKATFIETQGNLPSCKKTGSNLFRDCLQRLSNIAVVPLANNEPNFTLENLLEHIGGQKSDRVRLLSFDFDLQVFSLPIHNFVTSTLRFLTLRFRARAF